MRPLPVTAITMTSALGRGLGPTLAALSERRGGLRPCDFDGVAGGHVGRVDGIEAHRLPQGLDRFDCRNNRLADIGLEADGFAEAVAGAVARHGSGRIAVVLGTSTSGIGAAERAFRDRNASGTLPATFDYSGTQDLFSLSRFVRAVLGLRGPALSISTACASSAKTFIDAHHLIESGVCDAAVVGGVDTLCRMTLRGFAALELISPEPCRPCDAARAGISIGEAAGFALVERDGPADAMHLIGHGATSDGHHMSAPHPDGVGAIGAMRQALARAGLRPDDVDHVNLHGTGTRANDAMEDRAVVETFGPDTACSSTKAWTGHPLGAAGIVQAAMAALSLRHGFLPGCLGVDAVDPSFRARVLVANETRPVRRVVANSFGFGGINCSLVFGVPY